MAGFLLRGFRRPREVVLDSMGRLEREVMDEVWRRSADTSVRDLHQVFGDHAYTTLMTTLDRLYRKGLLTRARSGRAFLYRARFSREELERGIATDVIDGLFGQEANVTQPLLSCIVDAVSSRDAALLDELERLVRLRRRELRRATRRGDP